jgi:hypothetical protein
VSNSLACRGHATVAAATQCRRLAQHGRTGVFDIKRRIYTARARRTLDALLQFCTLKKPKLKATRFRFIWHSLTLGLRRARRFNFG